MPRPLRSAAVVVATVLCLVAPPASASALPDWRTEPTTRAASPQARMPRVVDLRYAAHDRFDRVVIDLRGYRPGYTIGYTRVLRQDGSGRRVRLAGRQKMYLRLTPAYAHDRRGRPVYDGPRKRAVGLATLRGVAFTGDFEGTVSFGFGLDRRAPYRIFSLTQPRRIVVDFKH